jgi:hypothetical protein
MPCYKLTSCNPSLYPDIINISDTILSTYVGELVSINFDIYRRYYVELIADCDTGFSHSITDVVVQTVCLTEIPCGCPPGYTIDSLGNCSKVTNVPSVLNPTIYITGPGSLNNGYGRMGAVFYEDVTFKSWPIVAGPGSFTTVTPLYDSNLVPILVTNQVQNPVWGENPYGAGYADYRLNKVGVFSTVTPSPVNEWIGFSFCQVLTETKTYYIGIAGDDVYRLTINGNLVINHDYIPGFNNGYSFSSWKIIPITLTAGTNIILAEIYNFGGAATLGFEIYDATLPQLLAITTANGTPGPTDLDQYIIFSTKDMLGQPFDTGINSGFSCPNGYSLNTCEGNVCTNINTVASVDCCYVLTACDGSVPPIIVDNDFNNLLGSVIKVCPENLPQSGTGLPVGAPVVDAQSYITIWDLTDCCGVLPPMRVDNGLAAYFGGTIVIPSISATTCWFVDKATSTIPITRPDLTGATYYVNCTECQGAFPCLPLPLITECTCFTISKADNCDSAITLLNPQTIEVFTDCETCNPPCFVLTNCTEPNVFIVTNTDLTQYVGNGTVLVNGDCWTVTEALNCVDALPVVVTQAYADCEACLPKCYILTDCSNPALVLNVTTDLSQYVGQVVHIKNCGDTCWLVEETIDCQDCYDVTVIETFVDCDTCLPKPPELPEVELHPRRVKPGYYTPACTPEYVEKVNCSYAEALYNEVISKRYGIKICCQEDKLKWEIKKHLLDLKSLYDPNLCKSTLNRCCPPTCVESTLYVLDSRPCPAPTNVTSTLNIPPVDCPPPTNVNSYIRV